MHGSRKFWQRVSNSDDVFSFFFSVVVVVVVVYLVDSREVPNTTNRGPSLNAGLVAL